MNRLEGLRESIDTLLTNQPDPENRRCGFVHLYGVSSLCALIARRRGLDVSLCAAAGMLHDLTSYETGDPSDHAERSAMRAEILLCELGGFSEEEISQVVAAIAAHSSKDQTDGPMAEALKDADVLQHYLYNPALKDGWEANARLQALLLELAIVRR